MSLHHGKSNAVPTTCHPDSIQTHQARALDSIFIESCPHPELELHAGAPVDNAADLSAADRALLIQPPGLASAKELLRIAVDSHQQSTVPGTAAQSNPTDGLDLGLTGQSA